MKTPSKYGTITSKGECAMTTFEEKLNVMPVADVITRYYEAYPEAVLTKLQLAYKGPFLKIEMVGQDACHRYTLALNAQSGEVMKEKSKVLAPKDIQKRDRKVLNTDNMLTLGEINQIALENSIVQKPFQWEMDRKKERTIWKVELADEQGVNVFEVKIDAQDGTVVQTKMK